MRLPQHHSDFGILILFCNNEKIPKSSKSSSCGTKVHGKEMFGLDAFLARRWALAQGDSAVLHNIDSALASASRLQTFTCSFLMVSLTAQPQFKVMSKSGSSDALYFQCDALWPILILVAVKVECGLNRSLHIFLFLYLSKL